MIYYKERTVFMNDTTTTLEHLKKMAKEFIQERDWERFHNPKT